MRVSIGWRRSDEAAGEVGLPVVSIEQLASANGAPAVSIGLSRART
jgi:hypothetical protein